MNWARCASHLAAELLLFLLFYLLPLFVDFSSPLLLRLLTNQPSGEIEEHPRFSLVDSSGEDWIHDVRKTNAKRKKNTIHAEALHIDI